jgi:hypothetical protein
MTQEELKQLTKEQTSNTNNNIVSVGYGYTEVGGKITNELGLVYTVKEKKPLDEILEEDRIPSEITYGGESLPTDVVQSTVRLVAASDCNPEFYEWRTNAPTNRNSFRPLKGGVSIGNVDLLPGYVGTLGFVAIDNESNTLVGVSNNHVLVDDAWIATSRTTTDLKTNAFRENGSLCVQPSEVGANSSNRVGVLKKYVPIDFTGNTVDGALIALDSKDLVNYNAYGEPFEGLTTVTDHPRFATTEEIDNILTTNPQLLSSGRTTGAKGEGNTKLLVGGFPVSSQIEFNKQGVNHVAQFDNLIKYIASGTTTPNGDVCYDPISGGDSGSALIADLSGEKVIIGLSFAGAFDGTGKSIYGLACRIDEVAEQLNISAYMGNNLSNYDVSDIPKSEKHILQNHTNQKKITVDGKDFWQMGITTSDHSRYESGSVEDNTETTLFDRTIYVYGIKLYAAGVVGSSLSVPTEFLKKIAQTVKLIIDPKGPNIDKPSQLNMVKTLSGESGWHSGMMTIQRIARGSGNYYDSNFLTDPTLYTGLENLFDTTANNDMVWYKNNSHGPINIIGDNDIVEVLEHVLHTIHMFGVKGGVAGSEVALNVGFEGDDVTGTELYLAMSEAVNNGVFNISGYGGTLSDITKHQVILKEYMYLLTFAMWDYSEFWENGSLHPEWNDNSKTPSGVYTNNPLGESLYNTYIKPVLSVPDKSVLRSMFGDNDTGVSGYQNDVI